MRGTDHNICTRTGRVKRMVLADVIRRVVEAAQPDKIILFGSAARGEMGPNSDLDLLVIKRGKFNYWRLLANIYRHLRGTEAAVDVVLITPDDVERYGDSPCLVIYPALREGKVVYVIEHNGVKIPKYVQQADELSPFAVLTRYPGLARPVNKRQYRRAVRVPEAVLRWAERQIGNGIP